MALTTKVAARPGPVAMTSTHDPDPDIDNLSQDSFEEAPEAPDQRITIIEQRGAWSVFDFGELRRYRDLFLTLAYRDVRLRYRQTFLGALWVVLQPLIAAGVTTILFSRFGGFKSGNIPYFVFSFCGMTGWYIFAQTLTKQGQVLVQNAGLVSKIYFPRIILPLSTTQSTAIDMSVAGVLLAGLMAIYHVVPGWTLLTLPVWLFLIVLYASGIGLFAGALMVPYRDVQYVLPLLIQYGMWVTPAGYSLTEAISKYPKMYWFLALNPLSYMLEGLRWAVFGPANGVQMPGVPGIVCAFCGAVVCFFLGALFFGHMQRRFADVI